MEIKGNIIIPVKFEVKESESAIEISLPRYLNLEKFDGLECEIEFKNIIKEENK